MLTKRGFQLGQEIASENGPNHVTIAPSGESKKMSLVSRLLCLVLSAGLILLSAACVPAPTHSYALTIPAQSDWVECGPIFSAGAEGEWDNYLWGGFAAAIVKRHGVFYLYYQGSSGYDEDEATVTWRSIGVATSEDGVTFSKYAQNPVLTWFPFDNLEEGAVSSGAFLDTTGEIAIYYGANHWIGGSAVNGDGRLAISADGFAFTDLGIILRHNDRSVWGFGDELFPVIGFEHNGRYYTYYIPNGVPQRGQLGAAWGDGRSNLNQSARASSGASAIAAWGPGSAVQVGADVYALFTNDVYSDDGPTLEVRTVSLKAPSSLSAPVASYQFTNVRQAVVLYDEEVNTWFMYYRSNPLNYYGVKMAVTDGRTATCPM